MQEQHKKKTEWTAPRLQELPVERTLGGTLDSTSESFIIANNGNQLTGSVP